MVEKLFLTLIGNKETFQLFNAKELNPILQLVIFFILVDFISWIMHIFLHKNKFLWQFHKVHHSVEQM